MKTRCLVLFGFIAILSGMSLQGQMLPFLVDNQVKKVTYQFTQDPIDVVIPCVRKDLYTLQECIEGIKLNGIQVRRIIVVSKEPLGDGVEWFDESNFPFTKFDVALHLLKDNAEAALKYYSNPGSRVGWYYQQLLKLYASFVIPEISSNVLVLDADTIFLRPCCFTTESGAGLHNVGTEYHSPYFQHADQFLPGLKKQYGSYSGISHHMLFQRCVLDDLFQCVETLHNKAMWKIFCECVDYNHLEYSGASEYEIYFNFAFARSDQFVIRHLKNCSIRNLNQIENYRKEGYDYVSCHSYLR